MKRKEIVIMKHPSADSMKDIVICRNCGREEMYGNMINFIGHTACPKCYPAMRGHILNIREKHPETYSDASHLYQMSDFDYDTLVHKYIKQ